MSLIKNEHGFYYLREMVELFHPTHRKVRVRASTGCRSLKDTDAGIGAQTWRNRYIKKLQDEDARGEIDKAKMHIHQGIRIYMDEELAPNVKNMRDNEQIYRRLTGQNPKHPALPNVLTADLTAKHMYRLRSQRVKAGLAASTINHEIYLISGALDWLADAQDVVVPKILWKKLTLKPFEKKRWATVTQLKEITLAISDPIYQDIAILLMQTGARPSEIRMLRWPQFAENEGLLRIERTKVENSEHGEATLVLTEQCVEILRRRYRDRPTGKFESEWVFQSERVQNQPVTTLNLLQQAIDKVGLNDNMRLVKQKGKFTPHSLRDSYASNLAKSGELHLYDLQKILGHTTPQMTQKYAHLIPEEASKKAKAVLERDGLMSRAS
uniref:Integrase n=1 Tax=uncultured Alphaproteobacteria bacterium TaxID=91750 RepID=A0A1B0Z268_9PROT|nr:integrase [uncultured Alphaproteobacteria bacterium]